MKIFWIILTLLALTGGVYVATSTARHTRQAKVTEADRRATATALAEVTAKDKVPPAPPSTSPIDQPANPPKPETPSSASPLDTIPSASVAPSKATSTKPDPAPAVVAPPPASVPAAAPTTESSKTTTPPPVDESANPKSSIPTEPSTTAPSNPPTTSAPLDTVSPTKATDAVAPATSVPTTTPATSSISSSASAGGPTDSKSPPDDGLPKLGNFSITPAVLEPQPDGSTLVDKRFRLKGAGTKEKPYEISWDLLTSAEESFEPRSGKKRIPERLAMLNNKYVTIKGYIAFPMMVSEPRELLMMLNQWDGCCIGVPPTPYDAIEVQLDNPVNAEERMTTTGGITGRFVVKPYIVGDWLVGLYVLERGEMLHRTMTTDGT